MLKPSTVNPEPLRVWPHAVVPKPLTPKLLRFFAQAVVHVEAQRVSVRADARYDARSKGRCSGDGSECRLVSDGSLCVRDCRHRAYLCIQAMPLHVQVSNEPLLT